jgi:hypothetical protein
MIGHGEIKTEQANERPDQPFGLAQSQAKDGAQGERRRDRQGRVVRLPAARGPGCSAPSRDRRVREPYRNSPLRNRVFTSLSAV